MTGDLRLSPPQLHGALVDLAGRTEPVTTTPDPTAGPGDFLLAALRDAHCPHDSETGDEGPVALLGRMPRLWRCDGCGRIRHDDLEDPRS